MSWWMITACGGGFHRWSMVVLVGKMREIWRGGSTAVFFSKEEHHRQQRRLRQWHMVACARASNDDQVGSRGDGKLMERFLHSGKHLMVSEQALAKEANELV
ncbi:hypothetical protein COCNU_11G003790 [Cocos nucifera]|uniref:Uncharacterized protein n=1 Tax=Cocos nucifera TaxID=13894 RepID=A0A8K0INM9_COCNU|nr:hypothetical protein COCNU_11G003790 [Cocos nucifera]